MKLFWMKNKALIAALCAVLVLGVAFWGGLRLFEGNQMQDAFVRTAYADAEATSTPVPGEMPVPTAVPTELPAEMLSADILGLEWKYRSVIPRISNTIPYQAKSWKEGDKVEDTLAVTAITRAGEIYEQLLHRTLDLSAISVTRYVDEKGYRPNILRLTDEKNDFVCVLLEKDLSLLVADNGQIAASEWMDAKKDAATVAEFLGTEAKANDMDRGGSSRNGERIEYAVAYELGDGRWITLAYNRNTLNGIQVHEDKASMEEQVCFVADITMNPAIVHLVSEECFVRGDLNDIAEGDMTPAEVEALYSRFLTAALGQRFDPDDPTREIGYTLAPGQLVYYRDESGIRENCYHIQDTFAIMDIAAKSGYIVRADCSKLYNPDPALDLRSIDYDHMGGEEYIAYVRNIAEATWGKENVKDVDVNAVYDGNYCTIDPFMTDGRWYEFFFEGGMLTEIQHFATERSGVCGWAADSLYVNTVTGEEFTMEW
ncbi:MAG: hypothetical protein IKE11_05685 [Clostridia bacterium]|nr:hypothetical protein [Clostridia bacterium]